MLERLKPALANCPHLLGRAAQVGVDLDRRGDADTRSHGAKLGGEAPRSEQRWVDALSKPSGLVQRLLHVARHSFEQGLCGFRIGLDQRIGQLEVDGERDEPLLNADVQLPLDRTAVGVGSKHEAPPRGA